MALVLRRQDSYEQDANAPYPGRVRRRPGRLGLALLIALITLISYYSSGQVNEITGETQRVGMSSKEEIALGLRAAPEMAAEHGGLHPDSAAQARVDAMGERLLDSLRDQLARSDRHIPYPFEFHLLRDPKTVNAFALPGGQVFLTAALYTQLENEAQLAGVLGHEIGHVLARHSAQQLAKQRLSVGLSQAVQVASEGDGGQLAMVIGQLVNMRYGRGHELEADKWGVRLMKMSGFDPREMIGLMHILERSGGGGQPEFMSTHPKPENRIAYIEQVIREVEAEPADAAPSSAAETE